ncbi:MAG: tetraacyldisaccharide 4'-kinase [Betaproteobacteria bacterium]
MALRGIAQRLPGLWYRRRFALALLPLLPLSWLFLLLSGVRRGLYRLGVLKSFRLPVPVVVVGNLTVGGSGKTPLVLWLVARLREQGWRPGIISRGYGGSADGVQCATADSRSAEVGDEPLLLARRSGVPVFVGHDRVAAGQALLAAHPECNLIVSDDGLQHYRLQRSAEIAVFDARAAGNGQLLPAGPLRESLKRLHSVMAVVFNSTPSEQVRNFCCPAPVFSMRLAGECFQRLGDPKQTSTADELRGKRLFAVAGIGDPARFFAQLTSLGLEFEARPFPDHHAYAAADLAFAHDGVVLMTEKDAVKCAGLVLSEAWVLPVRAQIEASSDGQSLFDLILEKAVEPRRARSSRREY